MPLVHTWHFLFLFQLFDTCLSLLFLFTSFHTLSFIECHMKNFPTDTPTHACDKFYIIYLFFMFIRRYWFCLYLEFIHIEFFITKLPFSSKQFVLLSLIYVRSCVYNPFFSVYLFIFYICVVMVQQKID